MGPVSSMSSDCAQAFSLMGGEPLEGGDGGSCLVDEFAEQHLISWLDSIRLRAPQGHRAGSHAQNLQGQCQVLSSRHGVSEGRHRFPSGCPLSCVRGCTHRQYPPGRQAGSMAERRLSPWPEDGAWWSMLGNRKWTLSHQGVGLFPN